MLGLKWNHVSKRGPKYLWVRSRNCDCLVTWFCYQLIAKPGNKRATVSWPDPYASGTPLTLVRSHLSARITYQAACWTFVVFFVADIINKIEKHQSLPTRFVCYIMTGYICALTQQISYVMNETLFHCNSPIWMGPFQWNNVSPC